MAGVARYRERSFRQQPGLRTAAKRSSAVDGFPCDFREVIMPFRCTCIVALALAFSDMTSCNQRGNMIVELDVYSGKPNPKWEIPPDRASNLLTSIGSEPETKADWSVPGLGYRGFILHSGDRSIRVYHGIIAVEERGATRTFRDSTNLEASLAADARQRGYADLVTAAPGAK
jgi:hypothetical protein